MLWLSEIRYIHTYVYMCVPLILDKYDIMIEIQKIKSMQEYKFAINVDVYIAVCK